MTSLLIFYGSKETYTASMAREDFSGTLFPTGRVIVKALSSYGLAMSTDARVAEFNKFLQEAQMFGTVAIKHTIPSAVANALKA